MNNINIQTLDGSNNWRTINVVNGSVQQNVRYAMNQVARMYPNSRIRAVDSRGSLVDILG